jgi:transposase
MTDYRLSKRELAELRAAHRRVGDVREAYRINAVILLGQGRTVADVADALLFDADTVRGYFKRYKAGGLDGLLRMSYVGSEALLDPDQLSELDAHLKTRLYCSAEAVARWVEQRWRVRYTPSGMTAVLRRLGYTYKKAKLVPGKADPHTITHNSPRCCAEPQVRGRNRGCVVGRSKGFSIRESRRPCD